VNALVGMQVKRRNDPTSAKASNVLGSYDKAKELVTSSHMIGAILQPATPRPSKHTFEAPLPPPTSRPNHKHSSTGTARNGVRPELSRQGVFEQFQQSSTADRNDKANDVTSRQSADQMDTAVSAASSQSQSGCSKPVNASRRSVHVANGRHESSSSSSSLLSDSKHNRPKLAIPSPKVSTVYSCSIGGHKPPDVTPRVRTRVIGKAGRNPQDITHCRIRTQCTMSFSVTGKGVLIES